jgi:hypothetical protein
MYPIFQEIFNQFFARINKEGKPSVNEDVVFKIFSSSTQKIRLKMMN